jgi:tetratricopeptide (TPR) repeat protein
MRIFAALFFTAICVACALPATAADKAPLAAVTRSEKLNQYFTELRRTRDPVAAGDIATEIWAVWNDSGSPTVNLLMQWADKAMNEHRFSAALDYLDQAIALKPDYAESWNKRATLHYHAGNLAKSMADISHALALEPRHFGALWGMAMILEQSDQDKEALKVWERLLEIYPANQDAQKHLKELADKLAGTKT